MASRLATTASIIRCVLACLACGCSAVPLAELEAEADRLRDAAMRSFEAGDRAAALSFNARAMAVTRNLPADGWRTVENYDDAGLYYFAGEDWARSAHHQAIAVLLACASPENAAMFPEYVGRLGWALAKLRPAADFETVSANPLRLLDDRELAITRNADIRRKYFVRFTPPAASRSGRPHEVYVRRLDPAPCGPTAGSRVSP
jgi:hypothetical protein